MQFELFTKADFEAMNFKLLYKEIGFEQERNGESGTKDENSKQMCIIMLVIRSVLPRPPGCIMALSTEDISLWGHLL